MRGLILVLAFGSVAACRNESEQLEMARAKTLIKENCAACHQVPGIVGADGRVGPSLADIAHQQIIAGHFANSPEALARWIEHPQRLLPGDAMPEMGLSYEQARVIATYLYTLE
jgi:cytochrome c2